MYGPPAFASGATLATGSLIATDAVAGSLLEVGTGFHPELTGRENIALAGALMGIDEQVMREITPGVIRFANIGAFIDAPMKTYSSGMKARVGFSIATSVDPDILLLDEVLQTGDNTFKEKSRRRIAEVLRQPRPDANLSWETLAGSDDLDHTGHRLASPEKTHGDRKQAGPGRVVLGSVDGIQDPSD